jgi:hypothetical protein
MGTGEKKNRREIQRVLNRFALRDAETTFPVRDHPEARDMIIEFAAPVEGLFDTLTTRYSMAIFAWNLSLVEEERRMEYIDEFITPLVGENETGRKTVTDVILALIERRLDLYPKETFLILPLGSDEVADDMGAGDDDDDESIDAEAWDEEE